MTNSNKQEADKQGIKLWEEERCKKHNTRWIRSLGCPFCTNDRLKVAKEVLEAIKLNLSAGGEQAIPHCLEIAQQALKQLEKK